MLFSRPPRRQRPSVFKYYRDVAQLVEYTSGGRVVARSSRVIPTILEGSWVTGSLFF
jgi:hypothetical protein